MDNSSLSPICLFVYNRLNHTRHTIEALQRNVLAEKSELFIFSDGPNSQKGTEDEIKVQKIREYLKSISGFKKIEVIERPKNSGLAESIISGVTEIVNRYGTVIVLEDDLITSPYFLTFMNEGLRVYQTENQVASIHGYIYPITGTLPETFFLKHISSWGWATWKRAWDIFEPDGKKLLTKLKEKNMLHAFDLSGAYDFSGMLKRQINGHNNSWAIRWYASTFLQNKLSLYSTMSLVKNIGFDGSGIHSNTTTIYESAVSPHLVSVQKIVIEENMDVRKKIIKYFNSKKPNVLKKFYLKMKKLAHLPFFHALRERWRMFIYVALGRKPWAYGYREYKWHKIDKVVRDGEILDMFRSNSRLPLNYGYGIDERIVEYPWTFAHLPKEPIAILDVGSVLNYAVIVNHPLFKYKKLTVLNIVEDKEKKYTGISYVVGDVRKIPIQDNQFDRVTCISTLEHVGMDNTMLYSTDTTHQENKATDYVRGIHEMYRVTKPGGEVLITVPFGKYENHRFLQQFDENMITIIKSEYTGHIEVTYYQYTKNGWDRAELETAKNGTYFDVHTNPHTPENGKAAAEAVACICIKK